MSHIKNYLPQEEDSLNQVVIEKTIESCPYKIGDCVRMVQQENEEQWIITDFSVTANGEPAALLESDSWHTFALLHDIQFIRGVTNNRVKRHSKQ